MTNETSCPPIRLRKSCVFINYFTCPVAIDLSPSFASLPAAAAVVVVVVVVVFICTWPSLITGSDISLSLSLSHPLPLSFSPNQCCPLRTICAALCVCVCACVRACVYLLLSRSLCGRTNRSIPFNVQGAPTLSLSLSRVRSFRIVVWNSPLWNRPSDGRWQIRNVERHLWVCAATNGGGPLFDRPESQQKKRSHDSLSGGSLSPPPSCLSTRSTCARHSIEPQSVPPNRSRPEYRKNNNKKRTTMEAKEDQVARRADAVINR